MTNESYDVSVKVGAAPERTCRYSTDNVVGRVPRTHVRIYTPSEIPDMAPQRRNFGGFPRFLFTNKNSVVSLVRLKDNGFRFWTGRGGTYATGEFRGNSREPVDNATLAIRPN